MEKGRQIRIGIYTAVIIFVSAICHYFQALQMWDAVVSDTLNQKESVTNKNIYIIGIDDKTLEQYGPVNTWSRELPARLVEILNENKEKRPAVIGFDVIYSENTEAEVDNYFAKVCRENNNVVAAMSFVFKEQPKIDENGKTVYSPYSVDYTILPYQSLQEGVELGYVNTQVEKDGYVRQAMAYLDYNGGRAYSFATQIYRQYQKFRGEEAVLPPVYGEGNRFYFSYSGKAGGYNYVSFTDVLDGKIEPGIFQDAIVLVGAYAVGMQDSYMPAISHNRQMHGVEIHANIIEALLDGKTQLPVQKELYAALAGVLSGAFFLILRKGKIIWSTVWLAAFVAADMGMVKIMYQLGYIVPVLLLAVTFVLIYAERLIAGYLAEIIRRKRITEVFQQYVAPQVVDKIKKDRNYVPILGGENRHVAVLFVDIRGFTTMAENAEPEEVVEILNEYLNLATESIFKYSGTLDKFVGDAAMAVFNAPFDLEDYIYRAVCTALDMKRGADALAEKCEKHFGKRVSFGIGIHCGNAVVGNIGCSFRMDYTAIGDTVNTAARLESNAKGGQILISSEVYEVVKEQVEAAAIGEISLKGKNQKVFVYQLNGVRE